MTIEEPGGQAQQEQELRALQDEVDRLRAQVAQQEPTAPAPPPTHRGARRFLSILLITVACLLAPLSVVSVWARGEVTDTERYVATVAPLASDPAVQSAVANRITTEIFTHIDVPALTTELVDTIAANRDLTDRQQALLEALSGPVNSGIESFTHDQVQNVVQSDAFAAAWTQANTIAHNQLEAALSGDTSGAVEVANNEVSLNIGDLVAEVKQRMLDRGFTVAERIPAVDAQMVIFQSDQIGQLQSGYALLNTLGFWLPLVAAALALVGVIVANSSRVAVLGVGIGLTLSMLVAGVATVGGRSAYLNALPDTVNTDAARVVFDTVTLFLRQAMWAGVAAGVVLILGAILSGPSRVASGLRGLAARAAAWVQRTLASWGAGMQSARAWVARAASGLRVATVVVAIAVVMFQRYKTVELVLWTTVGVLVALFVIQVFASGVSDEPAEAGDRVDPAPG